MNQYKNVFITGHKGLVGSALVRKFKNSNHNIIIADKNQVNLLNESQILQFLGDNKIDCIIHSAAKVGGIQFNINNPATMGYENSLLNLNIIESAHRHKIKKFIFLGSSCIYPRNCPQPMKEEYLLSGAYEPTNEMYGLAKTLGVKLIEAYNKQYGYNWFSVQPCNIYGINDNFDPINSHFMSANIRKFHEAKINNLNSITCWGTGSAKREILYVDDLADAIEFLLYNYIDNTLINIGSGIDHTIKDLVHLIAEIIGYNGTINWDLTKPDGMTRKLLDVSKLKNLNWTPSIDIKTGINNTYNWWKESIKC